MKKRKPRYSQRVMSYAIAARMQGMTWRDIRDEIKEHFQIIPPSDRAMRDWYTEAVGKDSKTNRIRFLMEQPVSILEHREWSESEINNFSHSSVIFESTQKQSINITDPVIHAGVNMLRGLSQIVGKQRFDTIIRLYQCTLESNQTSAENPDDKSTDNAQLII